MVVRRGEAERGGTLRDGKGMLRVGSGIIEAPFNWGSRFAQGAATSPKELIAAAHAGSYSMSVSSRLGQAGHPAKRIHTAARATIEMPEGHRAIIGIALDTETDVPWMDEAPRAGIAEAPRTGCRSRGRWRPWPSP